MEITEYTWRTFRKEKIFESINLSDLGQRSN